MHTTSPDHVHFCDPLQPRIPQHSYMATGTQPTGTCEESKVNAQTHVDWLQGQVPRLVSNLILSLLPWNIFPSFLWDVLPSLWGDFPSPWDVFPSSLWDVFPSLWDNFHSLWDDFPFLLWDILPSLWGIFPSLC